MARRSPRKKTTRRRRTFSLINALESYVYASIITENTLGTSPWGFITGATDIGYRESFDQGLGVGSTSLVGTNEISLGDMISNPGLALGQAAQNFQGALVPMAIQSALTSITFRLGKRLLRRPLANVNRNLVKPMLGAGVRL